MTRVDIEYRTGVRGRIAVGARLVGSWDADGRPSDAWASTPMVATVGPDGCTAFRASVTLDVHTPTTFRWGVWLVRDDGSQFWGIPGEVADPASTDQVRTLALGPDAPAEVSTTFTLSGHHFLGAVPVTVPADDVRDGAAGGVGGEHGSDGESESEGTGPTADAERILFRVWAPYARAVEVAFGGESGYIADDGHGEDAAIAHLPMRPGPDGVWEASAEGFADWAGRRYLYRVTREDGSVAWRTDMYSRQQCGGGDVNPRGAHYDGTAADLDGTVSCSVVVDPRPQPADFWADEFAPARPVPRRVEELVIYELHVGALGFGETRAGTFADAVAFVDYLADLGVNAVELLPVLEFSGTRSWGYGTSHFLAVEKSAGGREGLAGFVRACHRRGIAVLVDLVFNHYTQDAERAAWMYGTTTPSHNAYYWYEGTDADHAGFPDGGYVDNLSSGYAPRYHEEQVRALFVASAVALLEEFHVDGFRLDQTTSIHLYNALHADGRPAAAANVAGRKFLRELCQTLKTVAPDVILIAEDHSGWDAVTRPAPAGGLGFDARWFVDFYHHLIGDKGEGPEYARLLETAGNDLTGPLAMGLFAGALVGAADRTVVYPESHDEAGNSEHSERNILVAVNDAPLVGETRWYAEARIRCVTALSLLAPGTPMFLMGDEVGATKAYTYDHFTEDKEDLHGLREGTGAGLFAAHRDLAGLRLASPAAKSRDIEILHTNDPARVIAFRRWSGPAGETRGEELLVVVSLNNAPFPSYLLRHPSLSGTPWRPRLSTDAATYGGRGAPVAEALTPTADGTVDLALPAVAALVFERTNAG
ncbi:alpha-amylase family glycosyl hydrolase [Pseudofrankia sp. BMG5.36]|uniref:alpha-amylase family glycosyl hydrolase n=1 Tax=Pseudofrankia sp. BMG5.36 TaxID=1834512 RepID=UPI0008D95D79|nr:alpha-amylase family glycosyl hydrolase [Pseudofrankia sp. BMG5.36]OHV49429.1 alpha-amylase [Pseudofrankia sp. BMG5.36]